MTKGAGTMNRFYRLMGLVVVVVVLVAGCETPSPHTISRNYSVRESMPVDPPRQVTGEYDDAAAGGQLFKMYCGSCHNARPLGERPFSNYHVAVTHMRDQAYLTGKEYRQIMYFLRRWHDVGPPTPPVEPSPKRSVFPQPIAELRGESPTARPAAPPTGRGPFQVGDQAGGPPSRQPDATGVPAAQPIPSPLPDPSN
jgi:hypothetical protein